MLNSAAGFHAARSSHLSAVSSAKVLTTAEASAKADPSSMSHSSHSGALKIALNPGKSH